MTGARDACHCSSWVKKGRMHDWGRDTRGLMRGEADMALRLFRPSEPDLMIRRTVDCGAGVYAAKSYATAKGLPSSPHELTNHPLILFEEQMSNIPAVNWLERHTQGSGGHLRVGSPTVATRLIAAGAGIGVTTWLEGDSDPSLVRVFRSPSPLSPATSFIMSPCAAPPAFAPWLTCWESFSARKRARFQGDPVRAWGAPKLRTPCSTRLTLIHFRPSMRRTEHDGLFPRQT